MHLIRNLLRKGCSFYFLQCQNSALIHSVALQSRLRMNRRCITSTSLSVRNFSEKKNTENIKNENFDRREEEARKEFFNQQSRRVKFIGFLLGFVVGGIPTGFMFWFFSKRWKNKSPDINKDDPNKNSSIKVANCSTKSQSNRQMFDFFSKVVEDVSPAVVSVQCQTHSGHFYGASIIAKSGGTGFIVDKRGFVVTNAHVVGGYTGQQCTVLLSNGKQYSGITKVIDSKSDLALIQLEKPSKDLPSLKFGDSEDVKTGEFVLTVGSPLSEQFSNSVTFGVISNARRNLSQIPSPVGPNKIKYLQTDAVVFPGNSGGPLVNLDGEVIGVTSMQVASGLSFAIPSNHVQQFVETACKESFKSPNKESPQKAGRAKLGVRLMEVNESSISSLKSHHYPTSEVSHGLLVYSVHFDSSAYHQGIYPGDIITHVNGKEIYAVDEFYRHLFDGNKFVLTIARNEQTIKLNISL